MLCIVLNIKADILHCIEPFCIVQPSFHILQCIVVTMKEAIFFSPQTYLNLVTLRNATYVVTPFCAWLPRFFDMYKHLLFPGVRQTGPPVGLPGTPIDKDLTLIDG